MSSPSVVVPAASSSTGTGSGSTDPNTISAVNHCTSMIQLDPTLGEMYYTNIIQYCQQKLWHQFTTTIVALVSNIDNVRPSSTTKETDESSMNHSNTNSFVELYNEVIMKFESKLHPLSMARIAVAVANSIVSSSSTNDSTTGSSTTTTEQAKQLLTELTNRYEQKLEQHNTLADANNSSNDYGAFRKKKDTNFTFMEAILYLQSKCNLMTLYTLSGSSSSDNDNNEENAKTKVIFDTIVTTIQKNSKILQEWSSCASASTSIQQQQQNTDGTSSAMTDSAIVYSAHYEQAMTCYKILGPPELFYEQGMQFLTYSPPPTTTATATGETKLFGVVDYNQLAIDICLAGLTGDGVYNLGQIEQTSAIVTLLQQDVTSTWLLEFVKCVANGKVLDFQKFIIQYATQIQSYPTLTNRFTVVEEKLTLMALIEYVVMAKASGGSSNGGTGTTDQEMKDASTEEDPATVALPGSSKMNGSTSLFTFHELSIAVQRPNEQIEYMIMRACSVKLIEAVLDQVDQTVHITYVKPRTLSTKQMEQLAMKFGHWYDDVYTMEGYMKDHTQEIFA